MPSPSASDLGIGVQTVRGTAVTAGWRHRVVSGLPMPSKEPELEDYTRASRVAGEAYVANVIASGAPVVHVRRNSIGPLLMAVLGTRTTTGTNPWTHVFTLGTSVPWLTVNPNFAGILTTRLSDARAVRLTISSAAGRTVTATLEVLSGTVEQAPASDVAAGIFDESEPFLHHYGRAALKVEGVAVTSISDWSVSVETSAAIRESLAGPVARVAGRTRITASVRQRINDAALWKRLMFGTSTPADLADATVTPLELAGTPAGLEFTLTDPAYGGIYSLKLAIPRVTVGPIAGLDATPDWAATEMAAMYRGLQPVSGSAITATLVNNVAGY